MKSKDLQNIVLLKYQNGDTPTKLFRDLNGGIGLRTIKRWCQMILQSGSITLSSPPGCPRLARTKGNIRKDGAKPHAHHLTEQWCRDNFPSFIVKDRWHPNGPDLNPLGYSIWGELVNIINWNEVQSKTTLIQQIKSSF
ncbi:unnamed protein product [Rotaria socialis]|uniref:Transposase n=1 Tax=Rotaria socialis TaxID=392032 RepID=A0A817V8P5_9BILA|nr:unnamed protein product [Rotaria socialis]CAF4824009.1 unnamed protein product [Rotaria socialis]